MMALPSMRLEPVAPGGVSVLTKVYFTPTLDSFVRRMQSRTPYATSSMPLLHAVLPAWPGPHGPVRLL